MTKPARRRRLLPIAACVLAVCAWAGRLPAQDSPLTEMAHDIEALGASLSSIRSETDAARWRSAVSLLTHRIEGTMFPRGGSLALRDVTYLTPSLSRLHEWAQGRSPLPTPEQYRNETEPIRQLLLSARRLEQSPPDTASVVDAKIRLARILDTGPYRETLESQPDLTERLVNLVFNLLIRPLFGNRGHTVRGWVIAGCLLVLSLLAGHIVWELWFMLRKREGTRKERRRGAGSGFEYASTLMSASELVEEADRARASGSLLRALGLYYLALIARLAQAGCASLDRTRTNWELYRMAQKSGRLAPESLQQLAEVNTFFDEHFYGGAPLTPDALAAFRRKVLEVGSRSHAAKT
jgi:hypothetical protein